LITLRLAYDQMRGDF